jgi:DNA-binding CsgD family transcriptional regulator
MGRHWTAAEDRAADRMVADGYTGQEIADELGKPGRHSVYRRLRRRGRPIGHAPRYNAAARAVTLALVGEGLTAPEIAARRGIRRASALHLLERLRADGLVRRDGTARAGARHRPPVRYVLTGLWKSKAPAAPEPPVS